LWYLPKVMLASIKEGVTFLMTEATMERFQRGHFLLVERSCARVDGTRVQVTQPVGYVGTLPAIRINESTAEWTTRDCYV
jgi:hypothetical protein